MPMDGKKILVVDDDPDILDVITMILESRGGQVTIAHDGIECFEKLSMEEPDMIILDLLMPRMDGFAVYKELKGPQWSEYHDIPIIILSNLSPILSFYSFSLLLFCALITLSIPKRSLTIEGE